MTGTFLFIMLLYLWLMLLLVVIWITATHFSGASPSSIYVNYSASKLVQPELYQTLSRYTSITPVLKKFHFLPVKLHIVFKTATSFFTQVFLGILLDIFLSTAFLIVPGAVKVVVISLSFQSSTLLFINLSNSLVILLLPLFGMLFQMRFVPLPPKHLSESSLKFTCTLKHAHLSLDHPLAFSVVLDPFSVSGYWFFWFSCTLESSLYGEIKRYKSPIRIRTS